MQHHGIGTWIARRRLKSRGQIALGYRDQRIRYEELATRIARLSNALAARGISGGDRVAYLGNNHPSFLEALFAVTSLGAIFVPLNTRLVAPEIEFALSDSGATTLIYHDDLADLAAEGSAGTTIARRIVIAAAAREGTENFEDVLTSGKDVDPDTPVTLEDPALILYTSGTTGRPKGAVLTHGNLTWNSFNAVVDYGIGPEDRVLLISPLFHVAALGMGALPVLLLGGTVIVHEKFDPGEVLRAVEAEQITMLSGVPTTYQLLQEHPDWDSTDISSLRSLTCGGSTMPERMLEAYEKRGLSFSCGYGMTETSPGATAMPQRLSREKMGSSGVREFFTDVKIVDEHGAEVGPGVVGEILISGPNVITEYWNRPDATEAAFLDGWFRSGDLGYFDEDGCIYISDRLKDMIISGGENIYSAEVEAIIMEIGEVHTAALIGVPDEKWGEVPIAIVTLQPGAAITAENILERLRGRLAKYKIPKKVHIVEDVPRTASGKVRKADMRIQYASAED